ncbi:hypothetical protein GCM10010885_03470 [Alicyclobacillus cellulosilyticus]|uniref:Quinol oxidase subunit 4 n=1 Tax=Alicyclobacillus cellulosilyticus TaxID=1003997 RepID=A0A917K263_9BACL|nr:cytochrome C oxidase subunit IV family protein [Alicyclobacillus cellulosilyticus]GGI97223.1 hypothetical protein GCM10010885_03470 [Alicyclobacillus cellulosilyticus]
MALHPSSAPHGGKRPFPWSHMVGFILSIVLTVAALWAVLARALHPGPLTTFILVLGVLQIVVQLFFFMHITESEGPPWHAWMLMLGFVFVVAIVAGSIWIMSFGTEAY